MYRASGGGMTTVQINIVHTFPVEISFVTMNTVFSRALLKRFATNAHYVHITATKLSRRTSIEIHTHIVSRTQI